jgi:hypothetical protein
MSRRLPSLNAMRVTPRWPTGIHAGAEFKMPTMG